MFYRKYAVYHDTAQGIEEYHCDELTHENGTLILLAVFNQRNHFMCDRVYLSLTKGTARVDVNSGWDEVSNLVQLKVA